MTISISNPVPATETPRFLVAFSVYRRRSESFEVAVTGTVMEPSGASVVVVLPPLRMLPFLFLRLPLCLLRPL
jgi:hypothetical protein